MKIVLEKVRNDKGELVDLLAIDGNSIYPAINPSEDCQWLQSFGGRVVQKFSSKDLIVLELPDYNCDLVF